VTLNIVIVMPMPNASVMIASAESPIRMLP
jgi:hypothetical protein